MAYVKMGQIKTTPAKALAYITREDKTEGARFVSTNAAVIDPGDWNAVARAMGETTARVGRTAPRPGSVLAHHVIQSFDPAQPITPLVAHQIGVQLAERITGGTHEYVIATHVDREHVHNHIIFNAVNFETGRKYRCQKGTLLSIRRASDRLCLDANLRVGPPPRHGFSRVHVGEVHARGRGASWKVDVMTVIDRAVQESRTWNELEARLFRSGVQVDFARGALKFVYDGHVVRGSRLGESYTESALMTRLAREELNQISFDRALIVRDHGATVTVRVPSTRGRLRLTIPKAHLVENGATIRAYLPAHSAHVLTDRNGDHGRMVSSTGELYDYFARPHLDKLTVARGRPVTPLRGNLRIEELTSWGAAVRAVHQLEDRVNARSRWAVDGDVARGSVTARAELARRRAEFERTLVALTVLLDEPEASAAQVDVLAARVRRAERELARVAHDVEVLQAMSEDRSETLADRIHARARELAQDGELQRRRAQQARAGERGVREAEADLALDRNMTDGDGDPTQTSTKTLAERIEERAAWMRASEQTDDEGGRTWRR